MNDSGKLIGELVFLIVVIILGYLVTSFFVWMFCWAFGLEFMWSYALGIFAAGGLYRGLTK